MVSRTRAFPTRAEPIGAEPARAVRDGSAEGSADRLTHLVYEASLDNSLWPELILELTARLSEAEKAGHGDPGGDLGETARHFTRAMQISERIVSLQEKEQQLASVIDALSIGIAVLDDDGKVILENRAMGSSASSMRVPGIGASLPLIAADTGEDGSLAGWLYKANKTGEARNLLLKGEREEAQDAAPNALLLPREIATSVGFPARAAGVLLTFDPDESDALRAFAADTMLTERETDLLRALYDTHDLREAATALDIAYESARTYLKRIFAKTGTTGQSDLLHRIAVSPAAFLKRRAPGVQEGLRVRRLLTLKDGRTLEYFTLGPEDGYPILYFDALSGSSIDVVGAPDRYLPFLNRHRLRFVTICRPGGFRSTMRHLTGLRDYAPDIGELCDALGIRRFSALSYSFGSGAALAIAHELQDRMDRLVLSSPAYPKYKHPDWRDLDLFYQLSGVVGRRWPNTFRQILPFLIRSVLQNTDRYFDRHVARSRSASDIAILSSAITRERTHAMLAERTAITMDGMVEENLLNAQGWDFDVADIDLPVTIFHGIDDNVCPVPGARLLMTDMPEAILHELPEFGHYHIFTQWPCMIAAAAGRPYDLPSGTSDIASKGSAD